MQQAFKDLYPNTRVIIDCTEVKVQVPSCLLLQSQMYSTYKSGITPHGAVSFVSSLYTGSISDKEITKCCGILDLLETNDSVMAEKGFKIDDLLCSKGVELNLPPYLLNHAQLSPEEVIETKAIPKVQIHVERAIYAELKNSIFLTLKFLCHFWALLISCGQWHVCLLIFRSH